MVRRSPTGWHHSGITQRKKGAGTYGRRPKRSWGRLLGAFGVGHARKRRQTTILLERTHAKPAIRRRGRAAVPAAIPARIANWAVAKITTRRWRQLSASEWLTWIAVGAVALAFLALMAKSSLLVAFGVFLLLAAFAWRELGER